MTTGLAYKAASVYGLRLEFPLAPTFTPAKVTADYFVRHLSKLDYPGFAYVHPHVHWKNPAEVLLTALAQESLEARVAEGLPWLLLHYWEMDSDWLVQHAKEHDLQNRLGFVVSLARRLSEHTADTSRTEALSGLERTLDSSRLAREDYFYRPPRNDAERQWLTENRPQEAVHWNVLSDLRPEHLQYGA